MTPGTWSASGSAPTRCASTCSGSRRRCAPTRGASARTRSCWAVTGLVHDLDYERFPDLDDAENGHPRSALRLFAELDWPPELIDAVAGHATFLGVPRETPIAKSLFAVDELSGFVAACALVRPTGIEGMKPKSVKKKLKQPSFAAGVNRDEVRQGAEELGVEFDEHVAFVIAAMAERADELGLGPARGRAERMKRRWKVLIGLLVALAGAAGAQHDHRRRRDQGGRGDDRGRRDPRAAGRLAPGARRTAPASAGNRRGNPPIVLLHCYSCSLHWWDGMAPILARRHRVIRIDLLGHGGSQKPSSGYAITNQAALVAAALDQLEVQGAVVVGHSMGFSVATALAEQSTQLVDRLVNIGEGPNEDACSLPTLAELGYTPVLGQAIWRLTPDFLVDDGYARAFAPGYDLADGFPNPDQVVDDFRRDDLHLVSRGRARDRRLRRGAAAERAAPGGAGARCSRSSAPRTRSATPRRPRRPTRRCPAPASPRSRAPATRRTSRSPARPPR